MVKRPRTLTAAFVRTVSRPGVYGDGRGGRGLSLRVHRTATGRITRTWRQRVRIEGRLTSIGLGPYPEITLAEARQKALDNSRAVRHGGDPRGRGSPRSPRPPNGRLPSTATRGKPGARFPTSGRPRSGSMRRRSWTSRWTGSRARTCWGASHRSGRRSPAPRARLVTGSRRSSVGASVATTARDNPVDRAVAALPKMNGTATKHYRALPHPAVGASARSHSPGQVHTPLGSAVLRDDRVDGGSGRRSARGAVGTRSTWRRACGRSRRRE